VPTTIVAILVVGTPLTSFTTGINGELWTMDRWAVTFLLANTGVHIIQTMFGMIRSANTGVRTGVQIRRVCSVVIMTLMAGHRIIMVERCVVEDGVPIMKNVPHRIGRE
jgi:hypothetical protein